MQSTILLLTLLAVGAPSAGTSDVNPVLSDCLVTVINEAQVPAQESGVLAKFLVHEGDQVKRDQLLGQIDDKPVRLQKKAAQAEKEAAATKAKSDVDVRFAIAAAGVAKAEYEKSAEANRRTPGAIAVVEVSRLELAWKKAELQIEQSKIEREVQAHTADSKAAEVESADNNIVRRQITAPLDGVVVQVNSHEGEWVKPGDTVLRVVQIDQLRVEGFLSAAKYNPSDISGRDVVVDVALARGQRVQFPGKVVFVKPEIEAGGSFRVWARVENRQSENRQWQLQPGLTAEMKILIR